MSLYCRRERASSLKMKTDRCFSKSAQTITSGAMQAVLELGETVEEAAKRELFEEMGLVADEMELFYINSGEETHYIYPNGDEVYNVEIIYICRKYHGTIKPQEEEVEELKFFDVDDIPEDISDPIRPVFREYIKMRKRE